MSHARDKYNRAAAGTSVLTTVLLGRPVLARTACPTQATGIVCNRQCCSAGTAHIESWHCACQVLPFAYCLATGVQAIGTHLARCSAQHQLLNTQQLLLQQHLGLS